MEPLNAFMSRCLDQPRRHCSLLPPYILTQIARNGTDRQRESSLATLLRDNSVRNSRAIASPLPPSRGEAPAWAAATPPPRTVFDAQNTETLPGQRVRSEGDQSVGDPAVDEAYDGLGATRDLLSEIYGRSSYNGRGAPLHASVHYGVEYDNALWDGSQIICGDGDGELINRFTAAIDIIGHELGHGVTENESGLIYWSQSGALNESLSDVLGSLTKQYVLNQSSEKADWLIGEGLFTKAVQGDALRSMKAPGQAYNDPIIGKDPQPWHMDDYVHTLADNRGVHINSGIPNHAFYQAAIGIGGNAWERAGLIWYRAMTNPKVGPRTGFRPFARVTVGTAARLFGPRSLEVDAVHQGWATVGIEVPFPARPAMPVAGSKYHPTSGRYVARAEELWEPTTKDRNRKEESPPRSKARTSRK